MKESDKDKTHPTNIIICDKAENALCRLPDNSIDLVVTSPPYGSIRKSNSYSDIYDFKHIAYEISRVLKIGGTVCWNEQDQYVDGSKSGLSAKHSLYFMEDLGLKWVDHLIYNKNSFAFPSSNRYHQTWENVFVFSKGPQTTFNPIMDRENKYLGSRGASGRKKDGTRNTGQSHVSNKMGQRFNVWNYKIGGGHTTKDNIDFPALMPERLAEDLIVSYSNKDDIVLDPFNGGGTTCKMALLNNRKYIGIDASREACKKAIDRLKLYL